MNQRIAHNSTSVKYIITLAGIDGLQNIDSRRVAPKTLLINDLAPEDIRGCFVFDLYIDYSGLELTNMPCACCWMSMGHGVLGLDMGFLGRRREK
jgi:hypothetical protein